jgi:hypothetical protein
LIIDLFSLNLGKNFDYELLSGGNELFLVKEYHQTLSAFEFLLFEVYFSPLKILSHSYLIYFLFSKQVSFDVYVFNIPLKFEDTFKTL